MEKERGARIIAIIALVVAVAGLSIGFATYTAQLKITNTSATVGAGSAEDFSIEFSTNQSTIDNTIDNLITNATVVGASAVKSTGASMNGTTINGLSANFTEPGQSVTYTVYAHNTGKFLAYLRSVTIGSKTCTAIGDTTQSLVDDVCSSISITVKVGDEDATATSVNNYSSHSLEKGDNEAIVISMTYGDTNSAADGDFTVDFGQIDLDYNYVDASTAG